MAANLHSSALQGSPRHIVSVRQVRLALQNNEDPQGMSDMGKLEDILLYMPAGDNRCTQPCVCMCVRVCVCVCVCVPPYVPARASMYVSPLYARRQLQLSHGPANLRLMRERYR